ncbi:MAG: tetraacyldisaccharide 4'-kinase, partial [Hydrogenimonas sp.]|nr:tetraacyldisaccharide 4'-kinase [Hydrogenimonas sp.]
MSYLVRFFESLYYRPKWYHWPVALLLLPLSFIYASVMWFRRLAAKPKRYPVPIISVGNLLVGGSGKTPMTIELAKRFDNVAVVLRGYGRRSSGVIAVSEKGKILVDVNKSGDEAMLLAKSLPDATVIVAEDRVQGIEEAIAKGAKTIFLDDGFSKVNIKKFEILLYPQRVANRLPLPSGPFREFPFAKRYADLILREGEEFKRVVECEECNEPMLLVTAIANPQRVEP